MQTELLDSGIARGTTEPLCPVFGQCGGCAYQDLPYEEELRLKESQLRVLLRERLNIADSIFEPIVASPRPYHYRHRLDVGLYRRRQGKPSMGFRALGNHATIPIESCAIARAEISDFLPVLKPLAVAKLPPHYRTANLVIRSSDDGRVVWGGIGRHSLRVREEDYFFTEISGKRIFYSLETFFQANLSILPILIRRLRDFEFFTPESTFLDLYAGVGLFGFCLEDLVAKTVMIEECPASVRLARYNLAYHSLDGRVEILEGRVEDRLGPLLSSLPDGPKVAIMDPPRKGLKLEVVKLLAQAPFRAIFYLSCSPLSLVRDLEGFLGMGWQVQNVIPFDFFPKTEHLETLVLLRVT